MRDETSKRFVAMQEELRAKGLWTDLHDENLGNHICNADEVGGGEKGKRKKVYAMKKQNAWRNLQVGHDHNPFHATTMLLTFGNGVISNAVGIIHSAPGTSNPRPNPAHKEYLHPDWWQRTTTSGSMTRKTFESWCRYIVHYFGERGRCKKDDPIILMLDGHTSRWTHAGLMHLNENHIYPFCVASHTSAWAQANDCGINAKYKKYYGKAKKAWRLAYPFMAFTRAHFNQAQVQAICKLYGH